MIEPLLLSNLARWSVQVALLCATVWTLIKLLRVDLPALRHALWRGALVVSLLLPFVQPLVPVPVTSVVAVAIGPADLPQPSAASSVVVGVQPSIADQFARLLRDSWMDIALAVMLGGAIGRLLWLALGYLRLRVLRRSGEPVPLPLDAGFTGAAGDLAGNIDVRYVARLGQPVTFGLFRPVVLLPDTCRTLSQPLWRAILTHELWHVRRRDWGWLLAEEVLRAVFWFNPALWWLVSQVQSTREEVVDELTVLATNGRRAYLEALLIFADEPTLFPAAPFARRRHLFSRMLLISREAVMSSKRVVLLSVVACAAIVGASWGGAAFFPLQAAAKADVAPAAAALVESASPPALQSASTQAPPRDRRPGEAAPETTREIELKRAIETNQGNANLYAELVRLQEQRDATAEAIRTVEAMLRAFPNDRGPLSFAIFTYTRLGRTDDAVTLVERLAAGDAADKSRQLMVATYYWELLSKGSALSPQQSSAFMKKGIDACDRALALDPDYADAMIYKNLLLRLQANAVDASSRQALLAEADALRARAAELTRAREPNTATQARHPAGVGVPPPPPPPPPQNHAFAPLVDGVAPLRVGGNIKPPMKTRDVKPVYPPTALASRVQGVIIIEATIDSVGNVVHTRVLRGQPLLDQAAIDAVQQWQFTPTMLNGAPVPVIMTVTVSFRADGGPRQDGPRVAAGVETPPPPPPPPPPAPGTETTLVDGLEPIRIGGAVKPPMKVRDVKPVYPPEALAAGVQGVVIIQATIDTSGDVVRAHVLRSVPMLEEAALTAVRQWRFTPTHLNGVPTPIIMTVTVNFTQQ
jgi:TonB family protein